MAKRKIKKTVTKKKEPNWKALFFVALFAFVGVSALMIYRINVAKEPEIYAFGNKNTTRISEAVMNCYRTYEKGSEELHQCLLANGGIRIRVAKGGGHNVTWGKDGVKEVEEPEPVNPGKWGENVKKFNDANKNSKNPYVNQWGQRVK
jgi:hypothetical protein